MVGVVGSNPIAPTNFKKPDFIVGFFVFCDKRGYGLRATGSNLSSFELKTPSRKWCAKKLQNICNVEIVDYH